jgi:uncharacterized protein (DUF433 family)
MSAHADPHIDLSEDGVPMIAGTKTKVVEVVLDHLAHHWDAEEIQRQHPHLPLSAIYSALAYYHDHQDEMNSDIAKRLQKVEQIAGAQPPSVVRTKLRALGKLP